ncbi:MAG: FAD-dependent oxidoreductase [bacterium]|nr:FAD-dependent oxidoreductase [bacterium]
MNTIKAKKSNAYQSSDVLDRKWLDINIPCKTSCPIRTDIPGYIDAIRQGDYKTAYFINRMDNVLPGILGRVCNRPCESDCRHGRGDPGDSVAICFLKRTAADFGMQPVEAEIKGNGKTVCIIGAGPSGLAAANDLALKGYAVTILEQFDQPGGMLRYGIPQFRLPHEVVAGDVKSITDLGVTIKTNTRIAGDEAIDKLKKEYDAVLLAGGCAAGKTLDIPGLDKKGVYGGLDFMITANNEEKPQVKNVVIIGGGFTAVDCARTAYRLGAEKVALAFILTKDELSVTSDEVEAMENEEIEFSFLVAPAAIEGEGDSVTGLQLMRNTMRQDGWFDSIPGSEFSMEADTVVFAIGQEQEEKLSGHKDTKESNFFVAGDFRNDASTVIQAAADGRRAAGEVHMFLSDVKTYRELVSIEEVHETGRTHDYDFIPRQRMNETPLTQRRNKNEEVELGFDKEKALEESKRCYLCHYNFQIDIKRCIYCMACIDVMPADCIKMAKDIQITEDGNLEYVEAVNWSEVQAIAIDNDKCIRCGKCVEACPVGCISISKYSLETVEEK